jgi:plasmid stabilization system protein ParE
MAHAIIWLLQAAQDLQGISDYISAQSPAYADLMIERILDAVEDLETFPNMGSRVTAARHKACHSPNPGRTLPGDLPP